jgi:tetratricopeptide (TPR) repeat protein
MGLCESLEGEEALAYGRKAVELHPTWAPVHVALGNTLAARDRLDEAIVCFRKAIELDPTKAMAHHNLGVAFIRLGRLDEAIECYRKAVEHAPDQATYHNDLALALRERGQHDAALASFRTAAEVDPKLAVAHYNVGVYLQQKRQWEEALSSYRTTIAVDPGYAEAHCNMGGALQNLGRFDEALQCYRRGHEASSKRPGWRYPSAEWVRAAEKAAAMRVKLDAHPTEIRPVDAADRLEWIKMCVTSGFDRTAVRLVTEAFEADPGAADDLGGGLRYHAALSAARAGAGESKDASGLDEVERARLRRQALDWLRADLALHEKRADAGTPDDRSAVQKDLREWQEDAHLAGLRETARLVLLPAEERDAFLELWVDVAAVVAKATPTPAEGPR